MTLNPERESVVAIAMGNTNRQGLWLHDSGGNYLDARRSAQGQLEVTQVGNQVGMAMVTQLQKLGQLQAAQIQQESNAIAGAQSRTDAGDAKLQEYLANGKSFRVDPKFKQGKAIFQ